MIGYLSPPMNGVYRCLHLGRSNINLIQRLARISSSHKNMLAVIQFASSNNKSENLENIKSMVTEAASNGAKVINVFCSKIYN